jgi:hypothetical protein
MSVHLTDYDRDMLRHLNGEDVPGLFWGAAMGECIEHLHGHRLVERRGGRYLITDAGRRALSGVKT